MLYINKVDLFMIKIASLCFRVFDEMWRMLWNRVVCWDTSSVATDPYAFVAASQCLPAEALAGIVETRVWAERDTDDSSISRPHLCSSSAYPSWGQFHF